MTLVECEIKSCPHYGKTTCSPGVNCTVGKWDATIQWDSSSTHAMCVNCGQTKKVCNCR
jgi:hypothetical protein